MEKNQPCIYALHNGDFHYRYVGLTRQSAEGRRYAHIKWAYRDGEYPLHRWIRKHGKSQIKVEIIECLPGDELSSAEIRWIAVLKSAGHDLLNLTDGGEHGMLGYRHTEDAIARIIEYNKTKRVYTPLSEETKAKMKATVRSRTYPPRAISEETRKKMSESAKKRVRRKHTPESIEKMRRSHAGKTISEEQKQRLREVNTGKVMDEETKRKISAANKGRVTTDEHRRKLSEAHKTRHKCLECGMITSAGALGRHQSISGHAGKERLDTKETI